MDHRRSQTVYWYQRQFFKNVCVAGMAVRLNMSPALLCSHIHKSTYNDCKPETHRPEKSTAACSNCTIRSTAAGGAQVSSPVSVAALSLSLSLSLYVESTSLYPPSLSPLPKFCSPIFVFFVPRPQLVFLSGVLQPCCP